MKLSVVKGLLCALAVASCAERQSPLAPLSVPQPKFLIMPPAPITAQNLPVDSINPAITMTLPTYAEAVITEMRISGTIFAAAQPGSGKPNHVIDPAGFYSDSFTSCYVNVKFTFTQGVWYPTPCSRNPLQETSVDTVLIQGQGTIKRGPGIPKWDYECNYGMCWKYFGTQSYSLKPLSAAIDLTTPGTTQTGGSIDRPPAGTWTLFRIAANPTTLKGIAVPIRVLSWQWVAAGGGAGQTVLTGGATAIQRSAYITEDGSMIVSAVVNGLEQTDTVSVGHRSVKVTPEKSRMRFSIYQIGVTSHKLIRSEDSTQRITVSVVGASGQPIPNQVVSLRVTAHDGTGGHVHTGNKPPGSLNSLITAPLDSAQVHTDSSGVAYVTYHSPKVSGLVTIKGTASGATADSANIDVGLFNLQELPLTSSTYDTAGAKPGKHLQNHFATAYHIQKLQQFAQWYLQWSGHKAIYNDSSLPQGGTYDINLTWDQPHATHSEGLATDFYVGTLDLVDIWVASDVWQHMTSRTAGDESNDNHLHLMTSR